MATPVELLARILEALGDLPERLSAGLAATAPQQPGTGVVPYRQGQQQRRPDDDASREEDRQRADNLWKSTERLGHALSAFGLTPLGQLAGFMGQIRSLGEAWKGFKDSWSDFRRRGEEPAPVRMPVVRVIRPTPAPSPFRAYSWQAPKRLPGPKPRPIPAYQWTAPKQLPGPAPLPPRALPQLMGPSPQNPGRLAFLRSQGEQGGRRSLGRMADPAAPPLSGQQGQRLFQGGVPQAA